MLLMAVIACQKTEPIAENLATPANAWIDTVRFNTELTDEQRRQVFYVRNHEEDYLTIRDTSRIMLRFFWSRSFHPFTVVRLENRPEFYDSAGVVKKYEEWFATYKQDIRRINHDCPTRKDDRCYGKVLPFVHRQGVEILPVNQRPPLLALLDSIGFWQMRPVYSAGAHTDGSNWTLQVYYKGKYHEVSTDLQRHPIKLVCLRLLKLSKYPAKPDEIY
ncbi:hypothetical protein N008_10925 [Hymenobacter sp. APR13]|nr:hypothetical protein N008_10925 [Hymenobacter sp. APR13]